MEPIIEHSVNGRNIFVYRVEIEYQIVSAALMNQYSLDIQAGRAAEPPAVMYGSYTRLFDRADVPTAVTEAVKKFEAFVQGQGATIKSQIIRRCDLEFQGHAF